MRRNKNLLKNVRGLITLIVFISSSNTAFAQSGISDYLCERGRGYYSRGQYEEALQEFKKALLVDPANRIAREYLRRLSGEADLKTAPVPKKTVRVSAGRQPATEKTKTLKSQEIETGKASGSKGRTSKPASSQESVRETAADDKRRQAIETTIKKSSRGLPKKKEPGRQKKQPGPKAGKTKTSSRQINTLKSGEIMFKGEDRGKEPAVVDVKDKRLRIVDSALEGFSQGRQGGDVEAQGQKPDIAGKAQEKEDGLVKLSGEYRVALGLTSSDVIWKDANADKIGVRREKNWRYLWGDMRHNTYDPEIYSRFALALQTQFDSPFNTYMEMDIDPWTFIGKNKVQVGSTAGGDVVEMDLKYWSGDSRVINEVYRSKKGNIINLKQIKVDDGKTTAATVTGLTDWGTTFNSLQPTEINRDYRPVRKMWFNYEDAGYKWKIFPLSDQFEALTSDDPLRLSNNHVYWEESPWLDEYEPSRIFEPDDGTYPLKKGRWIRRLSFFTRDSDERRLTFLRGVNFKSDGADSSLEATAATPMGLWDEYDSATSLDAAVRFKSNIHDDLRLGLLTTSKVGFNSGSAEALNQLEAVDFGYQLFPENEIVGEVAESHTEIQEAKGFDTVYDGIGAIAGLKYNGPPEKAGGIYDSYWYLAHTDYNFYPGLSNYRYTRIDSQPFARHIYFSEISDDDKPLIFGDGIDRGRKVLGFKVKMKSFEDMMNTDINYRNVHRHSGKYVESVARVENTSKLTPKFTSKILGYYMHLPRTHAKYDPLIHTKTVYALSDYFSEEDTYVENSSIIDDKDPSVGAFGLGGKYDFTRQLSWEGIYERTNDPLDFPRGLLNDTYVTTETRDGVVYDKVNAFLYDQKFFDLPPYNYYNIAKSKLIYTPVKEWQFILGFTYNENKYASGLNDNVNHIGLEADFIPTEKLTFWIKYIYSRLIDVYKQNKYQHDDFFEGHHNVFFGSEYRFNKDESFSLLYGEFVGYDDPYGQSYWTLSTLDTQHIFRLFYRRKF